MYVDFYLTHSGVFSKEDLAYRSLYTGQELNAFTKGDSESFKPKNVVGRITGFGYNGGVTSLLSVSASPNYGMGGFENFSLDFVTPYGGSLHVYRINISKDSASIESVTHYTVAMQSA